MTVQPDAIPRFGQQVPPIDVIACAPLGGQAAPIRPRMVCLLWNGLRALGEWCVGFASLLVGLAILAALPIAQFLSLGYLLEAGGRVARTGRLRDGFIGIPIAARVGSILLGTWIVLLPLRFVSSLAIDAHLVDPDGPIARRWRFGLAVLTFVLACHVVAACARGGRLRHFLWPFSTPVWLWHRLRRGGFYVEVRNSVCDFLASLRLPYYFWLGLRGFVGGCLWLAPPVTLLALGRKAPLVGFLGAALLAFAVLYVPFLQVRFATEGRFRAFLEPGVIRQAFRRAPWAFAFALTVALAFALPLYLLKIEMIPREATWLPSLAFVAFIFPARLLVGWAYGRALRRDRPRHVIYRWLGWLGMLPVAGFYVLVIFFSQYAAWHGVWSLYEQHAFLLPVPFVGS